jgi:hypothetical protein
MTAELTLPSELKVMLDRYRSQRHESAAAWADMTGTLEENAARVAKSDKLAEQADHTAKEIREYCELKGLDAEALLQSVEPR